MNAAPGAWDDFANSGVSEIYQPDDEEFHIIVENFGFEDLLVLEPDVDCKPNEVFEECADNSRCAFTCEDNYNGDSDDCISAGECLGPGDCVCKPGFMRLRGASSKCVPAEECPHVVCDGYDGYEFDYDKMMCLDVDECDDDPCGDAPCINIPGFEKKYNDSVLTPTLSEFQILMFQP